jgi:hypothetical protein
MLELAWEGLATQLANVPDTELVSMLEQLERFVFTKISIPVHIDAGAVGPVRPLAYRGRHSAICQRTLPDMPQSGKYR